MLIPSTRYQCSLCKIKIYVPHGPSLLSDRLVPVLHSESPNQKPHGDWLPLLEVCFPFPALKDSWPTKFWIGLSSHTFKHTPWILHSFGRITASQTPTCKSHLHKHTSVLRYTHQARRSPAIQSGHPPDLPVSDDITQPPRYDRCRYCYTSCFFVCQHESVFVGGN